jgi:hypothetical protein
LCSVLANGSVDVARPSFTSRGRDGKRGKKDDDGNSEDGAGLDPEKPPHDTLFNPALARLPKILFSHAFSREIVADTIESDWHSDGLSIPLLWVHVYNILHVGLVVGMLCCSVSAA